MPAPFGGKRSESILTTLFGDTAINSVAPIDAPKRKKRGWLPLLTVLFLISYGLMTMLIVEQGATIESQRALIRELFRDSTELSASKLKAQHDKNAAAAKSQTQAPSVQDPSTQAQNQAPSSQATPQQRGNAAAGKGRPQVQAPSRPASEMADDRRVLLRI